MEGASAVFENGRMTFPPPATPETRSVRADNRFFAWTSGFGIVRGDGWIGGVASGLAARIGVDPLIVRGVFIVAGVFGFPLLLVYAIAWAVLPDLDGRMPLQEGLRGHLTTALGTIAVFAVVGIVLLPVPFILGFPALAAVAPIFSSGDPATSLLIGVLLVGFGLIVTLMVVIWRAARRTPGSAAFAAPVTPSQPGSGPVAQEKQEAGAAGFAASAPASELDAWRQQHAEWKVQDDAWRREQQDVARAAREQMRVERQERAAAFTAAAAERRRIRLQTKPRTPLAFLAVALGIAVVAGAVAALNTRVDLAPALGLFVAALTLAIAMVVAGAARRRGGFLAFLTVIALGGGLIATAIPVANSAHVGSYSISTRGTASSAEAPFTQPWGSLYVTVLASKTGTAPLFVKKRTGDTFVDLDRGARAEITVIAPAGTASMYNSDGDNGDLADMPGAVTTALPDGRARVSVTVGARTAAPLQKVTIEQDSGYIQVSQQTSDEVNP